MDKNEVILIVDDIRENRELLGDMLGSSDYEVLVAADGPGALEVAGKWPPPDLILLDIRMPGMDGYDVCRRLKTDPATAAIPVIFLSALQEPGDKVTAFQAGGVDYISKPFRVEEVLARVRTHLELQSRRRALEQTNADLREALKMEEVLNRRLIEINEKLRRSELLKSRFLSTMRRQIQSPLGSIMDMAGRISAGGDGTGDLAERIRSEAFDLDFQMQNIFFAAELEAGEAEPSVETVDVAAMIRDAAGAFAGQAGDHSLDILLEGDPAGAAVFETDERKLRQVILNLLANAVTFSPAFGRIGIGFHVDDDTLTLWVEDQGPGIPEESRDAVFERFRQLDRENQTPRKGQGLGLSVVKALLDLLGGQIRLDPGASGGARFTVMVPRAVRHEDDGDMPMNGAALDDDFEEK